MRRKELFITTAWASHCDIKPPENFLIHFGKCLITDFGPSRCSTEVPSPSDLWALGAVAYFVLQRRHMFDYTDYTIGDELRLAHGTRHPECPFYLEGPRAVVGGETGQPVCSYKPSAPNRGKLEQRTALIGGDWPM
jgi:serine/threonine protein kinase